MENERFFGKLIFSIVICIIIILPTRQNSLYAQVKKDSLKRAVLFNIQHQPIKKTINDSIQISLKYKPKLNEIRLYDPNTLMPSDPFKIDYRHHPYYTPRVVDDFINMNIMDRPPASSFVSLPTIALLAASVAVQYAAVKLKMEIKAEDYLLDEKYYPILNALWEKSPQTKEELYRISAIRNGRTMQSLQQDLEYLIDKRLLKMRKIPEGSTKYFPAQKKNEVKKLLENSIPADSSSSPAWKKLRKVLLN